MSRQPIKILNLGLSKNCPFEGEVTHYPIIRTEPFSIPKIPEHASHILYTSKQTVRYFPPYLPSISIGRATSETIRPTEVEVITAKTETAEGVIELLETLDIPFLVYPHSALARPVIREYLQQSSIPFFSFPLYTTLPNKPGPLPNIDSFDKIFFTSPSTVDAFLELFGSLPRKDKLRFIGPITKERALSVMYRS